MNDATSISTTMWCVWILIGIIGGYMVARPQERNTGYTALAVIVGVVGAVLGGYLYVSTFGLSDQSQYVSLVASVAICAVAMWLFWIFTRRKGGNPDSPDID